MNQFCINPRSELGCPPAAIAAFWERLARELAEEWCGQVPDGEETLQQEMACGLQGTTAR
jgi:hypothetical protein